MPGICKVADGVFQADAGIVHVPRARLTELEDDAPRTLKLRSRILAHQPDAKVHQMLIAFSKGSWNDWHSHEKMESVLVISGALQVRFRYHPEVNLLAGEYLLIPGGVEHQPLPLSDCLVLETCEK
jgi:quercetin dioxygenase-like cupin family protein